ncbi:MAG: helix-turn-helix domain-containing protein [Alphaproteobacteria bacterium]
MDNLKAIGQNIANLRKIRNLSQEDLCGAAGIDRSYLSEIENGHKNPSVLTLIKIADALGVSPKDILDL